MLHVTAEVLRQVAILVQPVMPEAAGKLLDLLGVAAEARDFAALGEAGRLVERRGAAGAERDLPALCRARRRAGGVMLIDTHCHLDFPDFAEDLASYVARAEAAGVGRMVTISTRVARFSSLCGDRRALPLGLVQRRHASPWRA